jgi:hypothetical protein
MSDAEAIIFFSIFLFLFFTIILILSGINVLSSIAISILILIVAFLVYCGFSTKPRGRRV